MKTGRRVVKTLLWVLTLCLSICGGALWFAYWYITDSETAARLIREHSVKYFPGSTLEPGRSKDPAVRWRDCGQPAPVVAKD